MQGRASGLHQGTGESPENFTGEPGESPEPFTKEHGESPETGEIPEPFPNPAGQRKAGAATNPTRSQEPIPSCNSNQSSGSTKLLNSTSSDLSRYLQDYLDWLGSPGLAAIPQTPSACSKGEL